MVGILLNSCAERKLQRLTLNLQAVLGEMTARVRMSCADARQVDKGRVVGRRLIGPHAHHQMQTRYDAASRNARISATVSAGRSSINQCPASATTASVTLVA